MAKKSRVDESREPGRYIALTASVLTSQAYISLSHVAKALLIEVAMQRTGGDNGRLLLSMRHLVSRGWHSADVVTRAKRELIDAGLIYQTVQGHRPNKASWFAVTWYTLDKLPGYDAGAVEGFRRGMYNTFEPSTPAPTREALFDKWRGHGVTGQKKAAPKINMLTPSHGIEGATIAPSHGIESKPVAPSHGTMRAPLPPLSIPSHGNPLDKPFCIAESLQLVTVQPTATTPTTPTTTAENAEDDGGQLDRVHDHDLDPANFDPATGEFCAAPKVPVCRQKQVAERWVTTALAAAGR